MTNPTNTRRPTSHIAPFGVRMQPELKARLEAEAEKAGRSLNAELIARLEQSLEPMGQGDLFNSDMPRQAAMVELLTLVRRLDVVDLLDLLREVVPAIPEEVIEARPDLKANLNFLRKLMRRLNIRPDEAHQLAYAHQEKLKEVYGAEQDKMNDFFAIEPISEPPGAQSTSPRRAPHTRLKPQK